MFPEDEDLGALHSALAALSPATAAQLPPPQRRRQPSSHSTQQQPDTLEQQQRESSVDPEDRDALSQPLSGGLPCGSAAASPPAAALAGSGGFGSDGSAGSLPAARSGASPSRGSSAPPSVSQELRSGQPGGGAGPDAAAAAVAADAAKRLSLPRDRNTQVNTCRSLNRRVERLFEDGSDPVPPLQLPGNAR